MISCIFETYKVRFDIISHWPCLIGSNTITGLASVSKAKVKYIRRDRYIVDIRFPIEFINNSRKDESIRKLMWIRRGNIWIWIHKLLGFNDWMACKVTENTYYIAYIEIFNIHSLYMWRILVRWKWLISFFQFKGTKKND